METDIRFKSDMANDLIDLVARINSLEKRNKDLVNKLAKEKANKLSIRIDAYSYPLGDMVEATYSEDVNKAQEHVLSWIKEQKDSLKKNIDYYEKIKSENKDIPNLKGWLSDSKKRINVLEGVAKVTSEKLRKVDVLASNINLFNFIEI